MFEKTGNPQESWSLNELAGYLRTTLRKTVLDKWNCGRAMLIAQQKLKEEGKFNQWVEQEIGVSRITGWRYRKIAELFTHEDVQRLTLKELYAGLKAIEPQHADESTVEESHPVRPPESQPVVSGPDKTVASVPS